MFQKIFSVCFNFFKIIYNFVANFSEQQQVKLRHLVNEEIQKNEKKHRSKKGKKVLTFLQSNLINLNELLLGKAFKFHSVEVTTILQQWVKSNLVNPYPSHEIKLQLATQTNLTFYM